MDEKYILGNLIYGDYDESEHYETLDEALDAYQGYVAEGLDAEQEKDDDDEGIVKEDMVGVIVSVLVFTKA